MTDLIPYSIDRVSHELVIMNRFLLLISILLIIISLTAVVSLVIYIFSKRKKNKS